MHFFFFFFLLLLVKVYCILHVLLVRKINIVFLYQWVLHHLLSNVHTHSQLAFSISEQMAPPCVVRITGESVSKKSCRWEGEAAYVIDLQSQTWDDGCGDASYVSGARFWSSWPPLHCQNHQSQRSCIGLTEIRIWSQEQVEVNSQGG